MKNLIVVLICLISINASAQQSKSLGANKVRAIESDMTSVKRMLDHYLPSKVSVVGIGSVGFQQAMQPDEFKLNAIKYLIENRGFQNVLLDLPDYQLRDIDRYLNNPDQGSDDELVTSIINKQKPYDLGIILSTPEFIGLIRYLKERNLREPSAVTLAGFGVGIPPANYFISQYTISVDSAFTMEMNKKIVEQLNGVGEGLSFNDMLHWYDERRGYLSAELEPQKFSTLTADIENIKTFLNLNTITDTREFTVHRDSVASTTILNKHQGKSIILSRNMQIAKYVTDPQSRVQTKTIGYYLSNTLENDYYSVVTDFSKRLTYSSSDRVKRLTLDPSSSSASLRLGKRLRSEVNLLLLKDFEQDSIELLLNHIIANMPAGKESLSLIGGTNKSFDAFIIQTEIESTALLD